MTPADALPLPADPEADARVAEAFSDPLAPSIYAEIFATLAEADRQLAEMLAVLDTDA